MSRDARAQALEALIKAHATELKLPTVRRRFRQLADEALREQQTPVAYLAALLEAEHQERAERRERRRLLDARFPVLKRLDEFRFADTPRSLARRSPRWPKEAGSTTASRSSSCIQQRADAEAFKVYDIRRENDIRFVVYCDFSFDRNLEEANHAARRTIESAGASVVSEPDAAAAAILRPAT